MDYTKKFILVPHDQMSKHVPSEDHLTELDREMNVILRNKLISDDEKVKLYMQVLKKRLNIHDFNNGIQEALPEPMVTEEEKEKESPHEFEQLILDSSAKNYKTNTQNILTFLKKFPNVIRWSSKGELIYKGQNVQNSNVLDLIKYIQMSSKKAPSGFNMFLQGLNEMNFPQSFIKNSYLKEEEIKKEEEEKDLSPPNKKPKVKNDNPMNWHSFS